MSTPFIITWESGETFYSIYEKIKTMIGCSVKAATVFNREYIIFGVSEIEKITLPDYLSSFCQFMDGNSKFTTARGEFNFKSNKGYPMWSFTVEYGNEDTNGNTRSQKYGFVIPRKSDDIHSDVKECPIMYDSNSPFIHYKLPHY